MLPAFAAAFLVLLISGIFLAPLALPILPVKTFIKYYRKKYDLPTVISPHNYYWLWGYGDDSAEVYIFLGGARGNYLEYFTQVEQAAVLTCEYCLPYENNLPIYICRDKKINVSVLWGFLKHYQERFFDFVRFFME